MTAISAQFETCTKAYCPSHRAGKRHPRKIHVHPVAKKGIRLGAFVLAAHFVMHFGWYAFEELWTHQLGLPDPAELGRDMASVTSAPIVVAILGLVAWVQSFFE